MTKAKHYTRLLENLKPFALQIIGAGKPWEQTVFNDITENGTKLITVDIPPRNDLPAIGLCGDLFFCEAGADRLRKDTLVIFRIESADRRHPEQIPKTYEAEFICIGQTERPYTELDDVGHLLGPEPSQPTIEKKISAGRVSPELARILAIADNNLRRKWLPEMDRPRQLETDTLIALLTSIWRQHDLERYAQPTLRQRAILNGTIKTRIQPNEGDEYLNLFNVSMLNSYVMAGKQGEGALIRGLHKLLERMVELPLSCHVRSSVWAAMAGKIDPISIRKEIKQIVISIREQEAEKVNVWIEAAMLACRSVAGNSGDNLLLEKIDVIASERDRISAFIEWANTIEIRDRSPDGKLNLPVNPVSCDDTDSKDAAGQATTSLRGPKRKIIELKSSPPQQNTKAAPAAASPKIVKAIDDPGVEQWVIRQRMPDLAEFMESLYTEVDTATENLRTIFESGCNKIASLQATADQIVDLQDKFQNRLNRLPDTETLQEDYARAKDILQRAKSLIGDSVFDLIGLGIPPSDLEEIAAISEKRELVEALPEWVWSVPEDNIAQNSENPLLILANPIIRHRISTIIDICAGLTAPLLNVLKSIPPPSIEPDSQLSIQDIQQSFRETVDRLQDLATADEMDREWIATDLQAGVSGSKISGQLTRLNDLKSQLSAQTFEKATEGFRSAPSTGEREHLLFLLEKAMLFFLEQFGTTDTATAGQIQAWIERSGPKLLRGRISEEKSLSELELDHNVVDHPRRRLHLSYLPFDNVVGQYGYFTAPVLLKARVRPENMDLRLSFEVNSSLTKGWPTEWEQPGPKNLRISSDQWRKDGSDFIYSFQIKIPVREPATNREPVEIVLRASRTDTVEPLNINGRLVWEHWDQSATSQAGISLAWPDGIETAYVTRHPIGPQEHLEYIKTRVLGGSSFAIVAPRRFGKTTLAMYLEEFGKEWGLIVPKPILCTDIDRSERGIDFTKIWETISSALTELLYASLKPVKDDIPSIDAFDHVRKAAKVQGKKGILLIFDEAQLFFPRDTGPQLGNALKDRLEREWSRRDRADKAPLYFGFVGLPGILENMGANFQGLLMPKHANKISQAKLNQLVYTFTKNTLHTTREAREQLTEKSSNLYMLKTLLTELVTHVNDENRNWIFYNDVVEIISELKASLVTGERPEIAQYLRDILNESEDVNFWKPRPCYPTAVALAKVLSEKPVSVEKCLPQVAEILTHWCMEAGYEGANRLVYTEQRVNEHFKMLEELSIIQLRSGFQSDILEAWLLGQSLNFPNDSRDRDALFAGALRRIRLPEVRESIQKGAQAEIYKFADKQESYALRIMWLSSFESQHRFHETIGLLEKLKARSFQDQPGAEYLYRLRDIGIADSPLTSGSKEIAGVEIYRWVDGICLEEKIGLLSTPLVASLGMKLSQAVDLIHRHNILHRDICPRNIILADGTDNPVLIDFGLARLSTLEMKTVVTSKYTAPEIRGKNPKWSEVSDIYSLGATLHHLLKEPDKNRGALADLIKICCSEQPKDRPNAADLLNKFKILLPQFHIEEQKAAAETALYTIAKEDMKNAWFEKVVREKIVSIFQSVRFGLHGDTFNRCTEGAQVLDFILEGYPVSEPLKLTYVLNNDSKHIGDQLKNQNCIKFLGALRITRNHYDYRRTREKTLKRFNNPSDAHMKELVIEGAQRIGKALGLQSLERIVSYVIKNGITEE